MKNMISFSTGLDASYNYAKIKVDSYDSLPPEKTLTFHNITHYVSLE